MGIEVAIALGSLALGAVSYVKGEEARSEQKSAQEKIQGEQKASNAARAAEERRSQIREERVRRARILQSSEGTGTTGSSGEFGALGVLGTNLGTNLGSNAGRIATGDRISGYAQDVANASAEAQSMDKLFNLSASIFSNSGGFNTIFSGGGSSAPPMTEATRTGRLPGTQ